MARTERGEAAFGLQLEAAREAMRHFRPDVRAALLADILTGNRAIADIGEQVALLDLRGSAMAGDAAAIDAVYGSNGGTSEHRHSGTPVTLQSFVDRGVSVVSMNEEAVVAGGFRDEPATPVVMVVQERLPSRKPAHQMAVKATAPLADASSVEKDAPQPVSSSEPAPAEAGHASIPLDTPELVAYRDQILERLAAKKRTLRAQGAQERSA